MATVTLKFDLSDYDDAARYRIYEQAPRMYDALNEVLGMFRTVTKYESFPSGVYPGMIADNLADTKDAKLIKTPTQLDGDEMSGVLRDLFLVVMKEHDVSLGLD